VFPGARPGSGAGLFSKLYGDHSTSLYLSFGIAQFGQASAWLQRHRLAKPLLDHVMDVRRCDCSYTRNPGCDPRPDFALDPSEGAIGQGHAGRKPPRTFQTLSLGARKPGDTPNLALAKEALEGEH
jgi:hypothetical protein